MYSAQFRAKHVGGRILFWEFYKKSFVGTQCSLLIFLLLNFCKKRTARKTLIILGYKRKNLLKPSRTGGNHCGLRLDILNRNFLLCLHHHLVTFTLIYGMCRGILCFKHFLNQIFPNNQNSWLVETKRTGFQKNKNRTEIPFLTLTNPFENHSDILSHDTVPLKGAEAGRFSLSIFSSINCNWW
jgi:hypothetical protein